MPDERLQRAAIRLGAIKHYLKAYESVFRIYEEQGQLHTLVPAANTLLERMLLRNETAVTVAVELMKEMSTDQAREVIRALTVDVLLNDRRPGERITHLPTRAETFARLR